MELHGITDTLYLRLVMQVFEISVLTDNALHGTWCRFLAPERFYFSNDEIHIFFLIFFFNTVSYNIVFLNSKPEIDLQKKNLNFYK
jgi:hypothetical protein